MMGQSNSKDNAGSGVNSSKLDVTCAVVDVYFAARNLSAVWNQLRSRESVFLWFFIRACCLL
jgi:hypothetical protein